MPQIILRQSIFALFVFILLLPVPGFAQQWQIEQRSTTFTNDSLGDVQDRWRTFSGLHSVNLRGATQAEGQSFSLSARLDMIAPSNLTRITTRPDRRYAGLLEFSGAKNWVTPTRHVYLGGGVTAVGPATGVGDLHRIVHDIIGAPSPGVLDDQLPNAVYPLAQAGVAFRRAREDHALVFRLDAQAGVETSARVGFDVILGTQANRFHLLRDPVTGQVLTTGQRKAPARGLSFLAGADWAYVADSKLFPAGGVTAEKNRTRVRAGLAYQGKGSSMFYGLTWLSPEFREQTEGQVIGTIAYNWRF